MNIEKIGLSLVIVSFLSLGLGGLGCSFQGSTTISGRSGRISDQPPVDPAAAGATPTGADASSGGIGDPQNPGAGSAEGSSEKNPGDPDVPGGPQVPGSPDSTGNPNSPPTKDPASLSLVESLIWKRYRPFEATLMQSLELTKAQVCQELGQFSCIDTVHLTILGGNEPFINGQHERADRPTVLTPLTMERVVLAACNQRLSLDKANPAAKTVFKHLDLAAAAASDEQVKKQTVELYQRFYGRDPSPAEVTASLEISKLVTTSEKVALGLCFVIGSSIENAFL